MTKKEVRFCGECGTNENQGNFYRVNIVDNDGKYLRSEWCCVPCMRKLRALTIADENENEVFSADFRTINAKYYTLAKSVRIGELAQ